MQSLRNYGLKHAFSHPLSTNLASTRNASLTSAISRGLRKGANTIDRLGTTRRSSERDARPESRNVDPPRTRFELERRRQVEKPRKKTWRKDKEPRSFISLDAPQGVPYTTAGSEFLYGTFAVKAALGADRRKLHKLYVWKGEQTLKDEHDESISRLARSKGIAVMEVGGSWDKMLMKMSNQRPHNGFVLEASPIPKLPVTRLEQMETPSDNLVAATQFQSTEDQITNKVFQVEGSLTTIPRLSGVLRFPLLLWLDRVTDTGNLGAIMRTAYFFGVDAILIPEHGTAPFGPVTVKASAGTAEYVPVLTVRKELDFVRSSKENGWKFFAAVAPEKGRRKHGPSQTQSDRASEALERSPCVLMVGNEGEGLRAFMQKAADEPISIESGHRTTGVVDSLNVSVAAALLTARFFTPSDKSAVDVVDDNRTADSSSQHEGTNMF